MHFGTTIITFKELSSSIIVAWFLLINLEFCFKLPVGFEFKLLVRFKLSVKFEFKILIVFGFKLSAYKKTSSEIYI